MSKFQDLTGQKFERLTVIKFIKMDKWGGAVWECQCDCGSIKQIAATSLKSGLIKSCGCFNRERASEANKIEPGLAAAHRLFNNYKCSAKSRGYVFEISFEEAMEFFNKPCYYCGIEPSQVHHISGCNGDFIYNGIDRYDNNKGYISGNCITCCGRCNRAKITGTSEEFIAWLKNACKHVLKE